MKKVLMMAAACLMAAMTFAAQCAATTKKGTQCKRQASPDSEFCWQHGGTTKAERAEGQSSPSPSRKVRRAEENEEETAPLPRRRVRRDESDEAEPAPTPRRTVRRSEPDEAPSDPATINQCQATTMSGARCKRKAQAGGTYCAQHAAKLGDGEAPAARPKRRARPTAEAADTEEPAAKPKRRAKPKAEAADAGEPAAKPKRRAKPKAEAADEPSAPAARPKRRAKAKAESADAAPRAKTESAICQGKNKDGEPCKRKAKPGSNFCWQHDK